MESFFKSQDIEVRASKRLQQTCDWVDGTTSSNLTYWEELKVAHAERRKQAATIIQAAFRGWEGRRIAADERARVGASKCIQRHYRGLLGRKRALQERKQRQKVVPTAYSLKLLRQRSREARRIGGWVEYFDPDTGGFWYLEEATKHSTWDAPGCFLESMICVWDPWPVPYSSPTDKPCRKVFKSMVEFQAHRAHAHPWQCAACGNRNSGLCFPRCELCGNALGPDGEDLEKEVRKAVRAVLWRMRHRILEPLEEAPEAGADGTTSDPGNAFPEEGFDSSSGVEREGEGGGAGRSEASLVFGSGGGEVSGVMKDACPPRRGGSDKINISKSTKDGASSAAVVGGALRGVSEATISVEASSFLSNETLRGGSRLRVCHRFTEGKCNLTTCPLAHPGVRDDAKLERVERKGYRGLFEVVICPLALASALGDGESCPSGKMCRRYHPYVRPSTAEIIMRMYPKRNGVRTKAYPSGATLRGTVVNDVFQGYGAYSWPNGDVFMGQWVKGSRKGGGIFRSADGREYIGAWEGNVREGLGVLRHPNGDSYEGQFSRGKMHGVGYLHSVNGDSYAGEFKNGKMDGMGCFRRKNGDTFMGRIREGAAHGTGVLAFSSGEKYRGDFRNDMRCGRGVCSYPNGAKFAGYWERNSQEGFGVYVSPGGRERYVGEWRGGKKQGYGRYIFENGDVYDGDFKHDQACGQGVYRYMLTGGGAGDWYRGSWEADRRHGRGTLQWANGSRYEGHWKAGAIQGKGVFDYAGGDRYRGEFKANRKHGKGMYIWANGNSYTGDFSMGFMCGEGEMKYKSKGHRYKGRWARDRKHGRGTFWYADGNMYEGEFKDDGINGKGKLVMFPGTILEEVYEGEFKRGIKHGQGTYVYAKGEGMVYRGQWDNGLRHGEGLLRFRDGSFYRGEFDKEKKHGTGCMVWADGSQYQGRWANNLRHGIGTLLLPDGTIFRGHFRRDRKHGPGTMTSLDGSSHQGEWCHDKVMGKKGRFTLLTGPAHEDRVYLRVFGF